MIIVIKRVGLSHTTTLFKKKEDTLAMSYAEDTSTEEPVI